MNHWLVYSLIALVLFGFWGFFPKMATLHVPPRSALVYEVFGVLLVGITVAASGGFRLDWDGRGFVYAFLTGVTGTIGIFCFIYAMSLGKTGVVVTMTALYPGITILLAFAVLKEPVTLRQAFGMVLAVVAVLLLSGGKGAS